MNLSRCCRESVDDKITSMDRDSVKNLSTKNKLSRLIEKLSRRYRDKFQIARWIEIVIRSVEKRSPRGSIERNLSRIYREVVKLDKKQFLGKTHRDECKQASYLNIDPINMLSSQKHFSTRKCKTFIIQNTHTH